MAVYVLKGRYPIRSKTIIAQQEAECTFKDVTDKYVFVILATL